jgi:hypothetical protein
MNAIERDELISAAAELHPKLKFEPLLKAARALDEGSPAGRWLVRVGAHLAWEAPELEWRPAQGDGLILALDAKKGKVTRLPAPKPARTPWGKVRFAPELEATFKTMARLCPVVESRAWDGEWALRLSNPEPWPRFLRLDAATPFAAACTVHSMILLTRKVEELGYRGAEPRVAAG